MGSLGPAGGELSATGGGGGSGTPPVSEESDGGIPNEHHERCTCAQGLKMMRERVSVAEGGEQSRPPQGYSCKL